MFNFLSTSSYLLLVFSVLLLGCKKDDAVVPASDSSETLSLTSYNFIIPSGFPTNPILPENNPTTVEGIALGKKLFFDPILSGDTTQSCASCHAQEFGFSDNGKVFSQGITGAFGGRNTPTIINALWMPSFFWDGRAATLEEQALGPVENPVEMHLEWDVAVARLNADTAYAAAFEKVFEVTSIKKEDVAKAISQFERTFISANAKYDKKERGDVSFTASETRGEALFFSEKAECFHCHGAPLFTDNDFHNNGLDAFPTDKGLEDVTEDPNDNGKFKSPTLRNIEFSGPYMHDGRFATLEEVVDFYATGIQSSATVDPLMKNIGTLSEQDKADLIAFLKTLTDTEFLSNAAFEE